MRYLLDTNIVSELMKASPDPGVLAWVGQNDEDAMLCSVVLAELASGIEALDDGKRKAALSKELQFVQQDYRGRILAFDESAAWEWARYSRQVKDAGFAPALLDSQIAAIAIAWGLTMVTRNEADFPFIQVINPFNLRL